MCPQRVAVWTPVEERLRPSLDHHRWIVPEWWDGYNTGKNRQVYDNRSPLLTSRYEYQKGYEAGMMHTGLTDYREVWAEVVAVQLGGAGVG